MERGLRSYAGACPMRSFGGPRPVRVHVRIPSSSRWRSQILLWRTNIRTGCFRNEVRWTKKRILSSDADIRRLLRRLKPEKRRKTLKRRSVASLPFVERSFTLPRALLYDTTVYVDILQGRFPAAAEVSIRAADAWHSTVTESELIAACGMLRPDDPRRAEITRQISAVIERRPLYRTVAPDREIWLTAGMLSGMLARLQGYSQADRRKAMNDALIFATARKHGMTVLTRNVADFDFLLQLDPTGRVVFYERS